MNSVLTILLAGLFIILEPTAAAVFDLSVMTPGVALAAMAYVAVEREVVPSIVEGICLAWIADIVSAAPPGVVGLSLTLMFLGIHASKLRFTFARWPAIVALAGIGAVAHQAVLLGLLLVTGHGIGTATTFVVAALPACAAAPLGFGLLWWPLKRVDSLFKKRQSSLLLE